jgi:hypothetical protein
MAAQRLLVVPIAKIDRRGWHLRKRQNRALDYSNTAAIRTYGNVPEQLLFSEA